MKRALAIFLAIVMLLSFAACAKTGDGGSKGESAYTTGYDEDKYNAPGEYPVFKEQQTITVMLPDNVYVEDWDTNYQTKLIEERLNADLVIDVMPSKEYNTKINLMAASGGDDFKDAILGSFSDEMVMSLADAAVIAPVTDYYYNSDIAYHIHQAVDRLGWSFFPQVTMPDGEIYGVPSVNEAISNVNPDKLWIYKPWFDKLNIDVEKIETIEQLRDALKTVVTSDPNGNGKADEVGIVAYAGDYDAFNYLMNTFVYSGDSHHYLVEDGKLSFAFTRDEWKEGLKFIKGMFDDGLIDPLSYSQDLNSLKAMVNYPDTIVTAFSYYGTDWVNETDPRRVEYYGLQPLNSAYNDGKPLASYLAPTAKIRFMVSAKASDIENTFRFGDYMASVEIGLTQRYGEKDVDWHYASDSDKSMYDALGYKASLIEGLAWSTLQNKQWQQTGPYIREKAYSAGIVWSGNPLDGNIVIAQAQMRYEGKNPKEYIEKLIYTEDEREIATEALSTLDEYVNEMTVKFITGAEDIDAGWDNFQAQIAKIGAEDILKCSQAAYDRMQAIS